MFYRPWKVEEGVVAVPFEVVWNLLAGFCWVVQLSGWLRFSCWTSSRSLEDDRACVARRFLDEMRWAGSCNSPPWRVGWEERRWEAQLDSLLRCRRKAEQPLALGEGSWRAGVLLSRRRLKKEDWAATLLLWEGVCGESGVEKEDEEGENMPYIGPVTSQVMGLRVTNGSWNLCHRGTRFSSLNLYEQKCGWWPLTSSEIGVCMILFNLI